MNQVKFGLLHSIASPSGDWSLAYESALNQTILADKLGYDTVLISEHHFVPDGYFPSIISACSGLATRTKKIRIGTGILLLPLHHPISTAEDFSVLDVISNGRAIVGLGYGYRKEEYEAFQVPLEERVSRFQESVKIVNDLLSKTSVSHEGKYFRFRGVTVTPRPIQKPRPPIWIAAKTEKTVRKVATQGDAWFADPVTPMSVLKQRVEAYNDSLRAAGKNPEDLEFPLMREAYVASTNEQALDEALGFALNNYRDYLKWGHMLDEYGRPVDTNDEKSLELLEKRFIMGNPEECIARIEKTVKELHTTLLIFRVQFSGLPFEKARNAITLFAEKVFPYFDSKG